MHDAKEGEKILSNFFSFSLKKKIGSYKREKVRERESERERKRKLRRKQRN